jgi:hypothetical protein
VVINKRKFSVLLTVVFLSLFAALRPFGFDRDYYNYLKNFNKSSFLDASRFEFGFDFLTNIFKLVFSSGSFALFLFMLTFVALFTKFSILSRARYFPLIVVVYFMLIFQLHEMMQIRIALATGIMFYTLFISSNSEISFIKKLFLTFIAVSMHYSVIVIAPLILFSELFKKRSLLLMILVLVFPSIIILFSIDFLLKLDLFPMLPLYLQMTDSVNLFSSRMITLVTLILIGLSRINYLPNNLLPWFYMSLLGIGFFYGLQFSSVFAQRFLEITIFSYLVWIPYLPKLSRIIGLSFLFVFSAYFFYRAFYISPFFTG